MANSGTDPLHHATVTDNECGPVTLQGGDTNNDQLLDPGETWTLRCQPTLYAITTSTATATGTSTLSGLSVASNRARATVIPSSPSP